MWQSWWPFPSRGGGGRVGVGGRGLGLTKPPSGSGERQGKRAQGRNDGNYNCSHTDPPARICILSPTDACLCASPSPHHSTEGVQGGGADAGLKL